MKTTRTVLVLALLAASVTLPAPARQGGGGGASTEPQVVKVTAKKYDFEPSTISVVRGRPVRLEITAVDHDHGIEIKELGVKQKLQKGKATVVEFTPDKAGTFEFHCSVFCGLGHHGMKGTLVVAEPAG